MITPMYCRKCGTRLTTDSVFCPTCGTSQTANDHASTNVGAQEAFMTGTGRMPPGRILRQRYRLLHTVGQGGMGAVYMAQDTQLGDRLVAVKEMSMSRLAPQGLPHAVEQFRSEAHLLAGLHHSSLPVIHEYFSEDDRWYLVMSFIEGQNLQTALDASPSNKFPLKDVLRIGIELCDVLDYLHSHVPQIIFRDLKPSNIMLTPKGHICLIDFGIARHFKQEQTKDTAYYYSVGYAPPEQYGQSQTSPRSDIYSLGASLHQMLSGQSPVSKPFQFSPLQLVDPTIPTPLAKLIAQMLEMNEQARPASVAEVKVQLQQILMPDPVTATRYANVPRQEQPGAEPANLPQGTIGSTDQISQNPLSNSSVRQIVTIIIGLLLYSTLELLWGKWLLSTSPFFYYHIGNYPFIPSIASILLASIFTLPLFFGAKFGPWAGCVVALGIFFGDWASGYLSMFSLGTVWYWYVIFVLISAFSGLAFLRTKGRYDSTKALVPALLFSSSALIGGSILLVVGDTLTHMSVSSQFFANLSSVILSYIITIVLLPLFLLLSSRIGKRRQ